MLPYIMSIILDEVFRHTEPGLNLSNVSCYFLLNKFIEFFVLSRFSSFIWQRKKNLSFLDFLAYFSSFCKFYININFDENISLNEEKLRNRQFGIYVMPNLSVSFCEFVYQNETLNFNSSIIVKWLFFSHWSHQVRSWSQT